MTAKEYLCQAYRLDQRIASDIEEARILQEMASGISAVNYDRDRVQTSRNTDAPFVKPLEKLWTLEDKISDELTVLSSLKEQIREVIESIDNTDERLVLKYRFILGMTWEEIGCDMNADPRTARRWCNKALQHVKVPADAIRI